MSDVTSVPTIKISNAAEFRKAVTLPLFADKNGKPIVTAGERGRLPFRAFAKLLIGLQLKGLLTTVDTTYFQISKWALDEVVSGHGTRDEFSYVITYTMTGLDGEHKITLTDNEVNSYLPNAKGKVGPDRALMLVALHLNVDEESAPLTLLSKYAVVTVTRVLTSELVAETTEDAPKGEDTSDDKADADKAAESEHASENVINAAITAGENSVKVDTPELVPAESAKPAAKPRASRKTAAKTAASK